MAINNKSSRTTAAQKAKVRRFFNEVNTFAMKVISILIIGVTILAFIIGAGKIFVTQAKLLHCRNQIATDEATRNYYNAEAFHAESGTDYHDMCRNTADSADKRIEELQTLRSNLHNSDDKFVVWAARHDFDILTCLIGVSFIIAALLVLLFSFVFFDDVCDFFRFFFAIVLSLTFKALAIVLYVLVYALTNVSEFFAFVERDQRKIWNEEREIKKAARNEKIIDLTEMVSQPGSKIRNLMRRHIG